MNRFKTYGQFINESKENNIVNVILDALEPTIVEMIAATEKWFVEKFKQEFSDFDREMVRLNLIFDMVKSVETYTQPTDSLLSLNVSKSAKGNIEISAQIQRDGVTYNFNTEAIYAGGHNIQRLHYRYIVKTNIPKTGASQLSKEYSDKIKKMTKAEKLNNEIHYFERDIKKIDANFAEIGNITDEQIAKILKDAGHYSHNNPSWEQIIKNGAAKNYNNSEAEYMARVEQNKKDGIEFWRTQNIEWPMKRRKSLEKEINKLQAKLDSMV